MFNDTLNIGAHLRTKHQIFSRYSWLTVFVPFAMLTLLCVLAAMLQEGVMARSSAPCLAQAEQQSSDGARKSQCSRDGTLKLSNSRLKKRAITKVAPVPSYGHGRGVVKVEIVVDESGTVECIAGVSGPIMLRRSAIAAARKWTFKPLSLRGKPARARGYLAFDFQFDQVSF